MEDSRVFAMKFSKIYLLLIQKAERKGRTKEEADEILRWFTGYSREGLEQQLRRDVDCRTFFEEAPEINPKASQITGTVCGVRVEAVSDPLMRNIRRLDKLIDELAKGRPMEKILRK